MAPSRNKNGGDVLKDKEVRNICRIGLSVTERSDNADVWLEFGRSNQIRSPRPLLVGIQRYEK